MYISRVYLKNIRGYRELDLNFVESNTVKTRKKLPSGRKRTVIIGRNGTCKTTLLRCIALGLSDEKDASGLVSEPIGQLVRENYKSAIIRIELLGTGKGPRKIIIETKLSAELGQNIITKQTMKIDGRRASASSSAKLRERLLVCGYGVGRSFEGSDPVRAYRIIDSVYSLFNYEQALINAELALRRLRDYVGSVKYRNCLKGIKSVLHLGPNHKIDLPKGGGVMIHGPDVGEDIPLQAWADGYRLTFNWLLDLYAWAMRANRITPTGGVMGIVLVDEIEQHLHPAMQTDVLDLLKSLLPDLQIITTTHSPLVALGVSQSEIMVFKREGDQVVEVRDIPNIDGYSSEDILLDPRLFNVASVYKPELDRKLKEYRMLAKVAPSKRSAPQKRRVQSIYNELLSHQTPDIKKNIVTSEFEKILKKYVD